MFLKNLIAKLKCERGEVSIADTVKAGKPAAKDSSGQSSGAEKLEGLISDIDLSDVPQERREEVKKYLVQKVKLYDAGFRAKTEEFSKEKKEIESKKQSLRELENLRDEIKGNPDLERKINKMINDFRAGNFEADDLKTKKSIKTLDKLIDQTSDAETKEGLRQMRQIVQEETSDYGDLKEKYSNLEKKFSSLEQLTLSGQTERVDVKLGLLDKRFGKELVDKYRSDIKAAAVKFPTSDIVKLFYHYANEDDIKSALLNEAKEKEKQEQFRKEQGSSAGIFDRKTPVEAKKDKHGRTNIKDLIGQITSKYKG